MVNKKDTSTVGDGQTRELYSATSSCTPQTRTEAGDTTYMQVASIATQSTESKHPAEESGSPRVLRVEQIVLEPDFLIRSHPKRLHSKQRRMQMQRTTLPAQFKESASRQDSPDR